MGEQRTPGPRKRTEPSLGDLDQLHGEAPSPAIDTSGRTSDASDRQASLAGEKRERVAAPKKTSRRRGWLWVLLAVIVLSLGVLAWTHQDALRNLLPRTQLNSLLLRADQALAAGRLEGNDGNSARELYEAVRALEPDNERAIEGLRKVGDAELQRARQAIAQHDYETAQNALADARSLLGGGDAVNNLSRQLTQARQSQAQTAALITQAQQAFARGQLDGDQGAAVLYRQALQAEPDNAVARHGLDKVGNALATQARDALDNGQLDQADALVGRIASLLPGYGDLPSLRASLSQARQQAQAAIKDHLDKARDALRAGHVTGDGDDNALAQYQAVLKIDPGNAEAQAGVGQVAQALLLRASASIDAKDFDAASSLIDQAEKLAPHSADLASMRSRLQNAQDAAAQAEQSALSPQQQARVDKLLARASAALQAGDILMPPGASAYDLYSEVLDVDGNNQAALQGLQGLASHARTRFDQSMSSGDLAESGKMLQVLGQLVPGDASLQSMRRRLADAWLDHAEQDLNGGDTAGARKAVDAASKLRPDAPRIQTLRARIAGNG